MKDKFTLWDWFKNHPASLLWIFVIALAFVTTYFDPELTEKFADAIRFITVMSFMIIGIRIIIDWREKK